MVKMEEGGIEWLAVVELEGVGNVLDVTNRAFRQRRDPDCSVVFYSEQGREKVKAMIGRVWRSFVARELWEKKEQLVV